MARALGSYPKGRGFKSNFRYHDNLGCHAWPGGQAAKTPPFHGGNTGSIPVRVTKREKSEHSSDFSLFLLAQSRESKKAVMNDDLNGRQIRRRPTSVTREATDSRSGHQT